MSDEKRSENALPSRLGPLAERFCHELRDGGSPNLEAYAAEAPELADELREVLPALELLERAGAPYAEVSAGTLAEHTANLCGPETDELSAKIVRRLSSRGQSHGRYQLKSEIGRGGQGAVLRVWDEDLRRYLAMKVILGKGDVKNGATPPVDSRTLGRFLEEAQVTGQLDHPGIVPVHELGLDGAGRVYFTMKLVKGRDLKAIFDLVREEKEGWTQTRALNVMLKVCEAMAYAHSKGVIHRDLKPSNVMVGRFGEVHVMDWGLARIQDREDGKDLRIRPEAATLSLQTDRRDRKDSGDSPLITMDGDVMGTPAYMSPEQAAGKLEAMGPHSDVYSAGAMLYHLLAGHLPHVKPGVALSNYAIWRLVQEGPPHPLLGEAPDTPDELVSICEKAMARDASARYADMEELAEDLRAFLEHRVVQAYETGALAELRKWVARNKALSVASAAAVVALVAGLTTSSSLYVEAKGNAEEASGNFTQAQINEEGMREERDRADANATEAKRQGELARAEADRATQEAETTERVLAFVTEMFEQQDPNESLGATVTVKDVLDRSAPRVLDELEEESEIKARLMHVMGWLYRSLGLYSEAEPLLEGAWELNREQLGRNHPDTLGALNRLATLYWNQGRLAKAEPIFQECLETRRRILGAEHPDTLTSLNNLALLYMDQGRFTEAEPMFVECLARTREARGGEHPATLIGLANLALVYRHLGRYEEAETLYLECLERGSEVPGDAHPTTLGTRNSLAVLYLDQERLTEAEPILLECLETANAVLGDEHPQTLNSLNNLARLYQEQGRYEEAEPLFRECLEKRTDRLGSDHPDTFISLNNLARLYHLQGRFAEAEPIFLECLGRSTDLLGSDHPDTLNLLDNLAGLYTIQGRYEEAEPLLLESYETRLEKLGKEHRRTLNTLHGLVISYKGQGRYAEAEPLARRLVELTPETASVRAEREALLKRIQDAREKPPK